MDRRGFLIQGLKKVTKATVEVADDRVSKRAIHWIRPPFAVDELDFLISCTRCGDCVDACPHNVIFPLAARLGASVTGTPALDVLNKGCHLCEDWPCVNVCEPNALMLPKVEITEGEEGKPTSETRPVPKMAGAGINTQECLPFQGPECGACEYSCPVPGALTFSMTKPEIDTELCTGCGLCREACITSPKSIDIFSLQKQDQVEESG